MASTQAYIVGLQPEDVPGSLQCRNVPYDPIKRLIGPDGVIEDGSYSLGTGIVGVDLVRV